MATYRKLTNQELIQKFTGVLKKLYQEKRISKGEFDLLFFYGLYNNPEFKRNGISDVELISDNEIAAILLEDEQAEAYLSSQ